MIEDWSGGIGDLRAFTMWLHNRRKFGSQTSDNMDRWKAEMGRVREEKRRRKNKKEDQKRESLRRKKMEVREKVGKSRNTVLFQWFVAPEGRKVGSLKRRVRKQLARWEMKNCTPLWREAHLQVKIYKAHQRRTTFRSCDVEKSARRCGAKRVSKSKRTKHLMFGPLLEVEMSKQRTPFWREAHFITFQSQNVENVQSTAPSEHFWKLRCRKSACRCGAKHISSHFKVKMYKMYKAHQPRSTFGSWDVEKVSWLEFQL